MQYRHGDLLLEQIPYLPETCRFRPDDVILEGEESGHAHRICHGRVLVDSYGTLYVEAQAHAVVTHEEHRAIPLPVGCYMVRRQRDYWDLQTFYNVED